MKKLSSVLLVLILLSFPICAFAEAPAESIPKVDINSVVNKDGTVSVTEEWTVEYIAAADTFDRQFDVYGGSNQKMSFDEIKDITVAIKEEQVGSQGGKTEQAKEDPTGKGVNTFRSGLSEDGGSFDIIINSPSAQETKVYTISYTMTGAVKKSGGKAIFATTIIGKKFLYTSNNVTVNVTLPAGIESKDIETENGKVNGSNVTFNMSRVYDTMDVEVSVPSSAFDDGALVKYSSAKEGLSKFGNKVLGVLPFVICAIVIILLIVVLLFSDKIVRRVYNKNAKALAVNPENIPSSLSPDITPCAAYKMLVPYSRIKPKSTSKKAPYLFALAILECLDDGYIRPLEDGKGFIIGSPEEAPDYILSVLGFLKHFSTKSGNRFIIDDDFEKRVSAECFSNYDLLTNYIMTFYTLVPSVKSKFFKDEHNKDIYESACALKLNLEKNKDVSTYSDCFDRVLKGSKAGDDDVFSFMFSSLSAEKVFKTNKKSAGSTISNAIYDIYSIYTKSK